MKKLKNIISVCFLTKLIYMDGFYLDPLSLILATMSNLSATPGGFFTEEGYWIPDEPSPSAPSLAMPSAPSLAIPSAPSLAMPSAPSLAMPSAPSLAMPSAPPTSHVDWEEAGVIIIDENYYKRRNGYYPSIFLGLNSATGLYELFYGPRKTDDTSAADTARRELMEKSSHMFDISDKVLSETRSVTSCDGKRRAFVLRVFRNAPIDSAVFKNNTRKLHGASHQFSKITRISIEAAIKSCIETHDARCPFTLNDVNDNRITICPRDANFIKLALVAKLDYDAHPPTFMEFIPLFNSTTGGKKNKFLNGISTYMA
jgi:hypothetical protein